MANEQKPPASFSPRRRWKIGFDVFARTILVLAVIVMVNFLGAKFFGRFYMSSQTHVELSSRSEEIVKSVTNNVAVTLYYDKSDDFYPTIVALLNEYRSANPKISVKTVDYTRDAGEAEKVKEQYKLNSPTAKNLVIFDCDGHVKIANGDALTDTKLEPVPNSTDHEYRRKPVAFKGEMLFTSMLLAITNPKPFKAYFLQGDGEPSLTDSGEQSYMKFAAVLQQNYIDIEPVQLFGDDKIPDDCNLLIIAGPTSMLSNTELQKIDQYLSQGGRLFALFNYFSRDKQIGLEPILTRWGVAVGANQVQDPNNHTAGGQDVIVYNFSQHPVVDPLTGYALQLILPRTISRIDWKNPPANAPEVTELAFSSSASVLAGQSALAPRSYSLMAAVEQKPAAGVANARGMTRMIIVGDSFFLGNRQIDSGANRDFLGYAVNWLLDRTTLLKGIGPQPVTEFRLILSQTQMQHIRWLLLGALPGAVLLLGGLVWLVRRK
ncbi:MAG TPA: GldG family protein [Verrucomicrobiae bacterium]|nr:GldG family protein [Verrucomicrobiae bacterium]